MSEIPKTEKSDFIKAVKEKIKEMKDSDYIAGEYEHTVVCKSKTSDAALEFWKFTFHNTQSNKFKAIITLKIKWKNGLIQDIELPSETWNSSKEFAEYLMRECDK